MRSLHLFIKRLVDILGSGLGLLIILPLFLIVVLLIKLTMPGPIFFKQERVGLNRELFHILKFRTMKVDAEAETKLDLSKDKERLTKFGKVLRRTKVDELPQLLNVFLGDMSLVGPRPTIMRQVEEYTEYQAQRLNMRPGMTGLAQVNGNISLPWEQRIEYDVEYVTNFSFILDIKIMLKTIAIVVIGEERFKKERSINGSVTRDKVKVLASKGNVNK